MLTDGLCCGCWRHSEFGDSIRLRDVDGAGGVGYVLFGGFQVFCLFLGSFIYLQQIKETGGIHIQSSISPKGGSAIAAYDGGS